jgi:hypothetical protein
MLVMHGIGRNVACITRPKGGAVTATDQCNCAVKNEKPRVKSMGVGWTVLVELNLTVPEFIAL